MQSVIHTTFGQANLSRQRDDDKVLTYVVCDKILVPGTAHEEFLRIIEYSLIPNGHLIA